MRFLFSHHFLFPLMWRLYCLGVGNKGYTWLLLIGYEWFRNFLTKFRIFHQPVQPVQCHSWLPLSATRDSWPFFVRFSLIWARNWEPFLCLFPYSVRNFLAKFGIFYQPSEPVGKRFNQFSAITGYLCQPWGTLDLSLSGSHSSRLGIENCFFCLFSYSVRSFLDKFRIFYQLSEPVRNRFNLFSAIAGCLC